MNTAEYLKIVKELGIFRGKLAEGFPDETTVGKADGNDEAVSMARRVAGGRRPKHEWGWTKKRKPGSLE